MNEFFIHLIDILEKLTQKDQSIILVGDLNINIQEGGSSHKKLLDVTKAYNLTINILPGVTESMAIIIDQIRNNIPTKCYHTEVINSLLLDHFAQCIIINMTVPQQTRCYKEVRDISEANITNLCSSIQTETWIEVSQEKCCRKKLGLLLQHFNYYFNIACPKLRRNTVKYFQKSLDK
jgi:hypothetical protein